MHSLEGEVSKIGSAALALVDVLDQTVDEQFRGIKLIGQFSRRAILEPGCILVVGHVGPGRPIVGPGGIEREGSVEAMMVRQVAITMAEMPLA